ncbi:MAG: hypothetical protein EBR82_81365, partial [Caulobacteraceae bacterium]|nr:hypothetical protein [Caulobacteraceae bacterium]
PRVLRDDKFAKLKQSISEFPKMLSLRPMVIDENNMILGGNMRLRALQDLGYTEIDDAWVKRSSDLTEEEKQRFIIADNVAFGEWDWDTLANDWDAEQLSDWGLEVKGFETGEYEEIKNNDKIELDNYIIRYEIIFNNEGEQNKWYLFMKMLKDKYLECDTFSERLIKFLEEFKYV